MHETESQVILNGSRDIGFTMDLVKKDIGLFQEIANRNGVALAENVQNYRITIVREQTGNAEDVLQRLDRIVPLGEGEIEAVLKEMKRRPGFVPVSVAEHLTWEQLAAVSAPMAGE